MLACGFNRNGRCGVPEDDPNPSPNYPCPDPNRQVDLGDLNGKGWVPFFAAVPALLAFILVFLDDGSPGAP